MQYSVPVCQGARSSWGRYCLLPGGGGGVGNHLSFFSRREKKYVNMWYAKECRMCKCNMPNNAHSYSNQLFPSGETRVLDTARPHPSGPWRAGWVPTNHRLDSAWPDFPWLWKLPILSCQSFTECLKAAQNSHLVCKGATRKGITFGIQRQC